jgi:hypothetical protein
VIRLSADEAAHISKRNRDAQKGTGFDIYLPIATVSVANVREHWAKRAARAKIHRQQAYLMTQALKGLVLPAIIALTRVSPRMLDSDNLVSSLKNVRDGIADRLGIDDRDPRVEWAYGQEKGAPKQHGVKVRADMVAPF